MIRPTDYCSLASYPGHMRGRRITRMGRGYPFTTSCPIVSWFISCLVAKQVYMMLTFMLNSTIVVLELWLISDICSTWPNRMYNAHICTGTARRKASCTCVVLLYLLSGSKAGALYIVQCTHTKIFLFLCQHSPYKRSYNFISIEE